MKPQLNDFVGWPLGAELLRVEVSGETHRLTDVGVCGPAYLEPIPCCSVTCENLRLGHSTDVERAVRQHDALVSVLMRHEVSCHTIPALRGSPDLCFARDIAVGSPWGPVILNPATPHRRQEADYLVGVLEGWSARAVERIRAGNIEGGDICIARPGLLIIGVSGGRTDEMGAASFARRFRENGWEVVLCRFDPHFLHLDTIFCMLNERTALICEDAVDDRFLDELFHRGIETLPVSYKEARKLGCNVLSIDGSTVIANTGTRRVSAMMRSRGFIVEEVEIGELTACGGGVHCLTMPLRRVPPDQP